MSEKKESYEVCVNDNDDLWRLNLYVCLFGSFTTFMGMTISFPFLPLFIKDLGVGDLNKVIYMSSLSYSVTFISAALFSPLWGIVADRYGNKTTLLRASLCMSVIIICTGLSKTIEQLIFFRALLGMFGGYSAGASILIAKQVPDNRSAWALGMLSTCSLLGSLTGPLIGGIFASLFGIRQTFFIGGGIVFLAFILTLSYIRERYQCTQMDDLYVKKGDGGEKIKLVAMIFTVLLLVTSCMTIEPIITIQIEKLNGNYYSVELAAGIAISAISIGNMLAAPYYGKITKIIGLEKTMAFCLLSAGVLLILQGYSVSVWGFTTLRFLMGIAIAGIIPCATLILSRNSNKETVGSAIGWLNSVQYLGQVLGPLIGGLIAVQIGINEVFIASGIILFIAMTMNVLMVSITVRK
ncbi:TPA: MFS transporter [Klebsiella michiganensis]|nr:MFS transporter [Klebsiella oxytoca]HCQ8236600.1 MFS transporter [Klebsiella michiganensis]